MFVYDPDMAVYSTLFRPLAFRLDPETAHHLAIGTGARLGWAAGAMRAVTLSTIQDCQPSLLACIFLTRSGSPPVSIKAAPPSARWPASASVRSRSAQFPLTRRRAIQNRGCGACLQMTPLSCITACRTMALRRLPGESRGHACRWRSASIWW
jgi:hypothetical protein